MIGMCFWRIVICVHIVCVRVTYVHEVDAPVCVVDVCVLLMVCVYVAVVYYYDVCVHVESVIVKIDVGEYT